MICFECAKVNDEVAAVGVCQHCGVGLCLDHLVEARAYRVGGRRSHGQDQREPAGVAEISSIRLPMR